MRRRGHAEVWEYASPLGPLCGRRSKGRAIPLGNSARVVAAHAFVGDILLTSYFFGCEWDTSS